MRRIFAILIALTMCFALVFCVSAESEQKFVVDEADLLTQSEEEKLNEQLQDIQKEHKLDVMIVTKDGGCASDLDDYAESYYLSAGFGKDGIVLLVDVVGRDWTYVLFGKSDKEFDEKQCEKLEDKFVPKLTDGDYFEAFESFADTYVDTMTSGGFSVVTIVISILAGALLSFLIPMSILKAQLKTVRMQPAASSYVRQNSMRVDQKRDIFLYRNVTRTAKPKNNSGGHSGSTSSGNSSRSGKF